MKAGLQKAVALVGLAFASACASPTALPPPEGSEVALFDAAVLHEVEVEMDPLDWRTLRLNFESDQYYAADVSIDGVKVAQAGVRSRGGATRSGTKPSLQLHFNEYLKAQRFQGRRRVAIKNLLDDPSFLREYLSMTTYQAMGVAAPGVSFARLNVNGEYFGLYNLIENVDESFLEERFSQSSGYLYDYQYAGPWDLGSRGDDPSSYVPTPFRPETHEDEPDPRGLLELLRAINTGPDETWGTTLSTYLDLGQLTTYLGVENALTAGDGILGIYGVNNFLLYQYAGQKLFVFIPWDRGATFQAAEWPLLYRMDETVLTRRLVADPELQKLYLGAVRRTVDECLNERVAGQRLEAAYVLVREAALQDAKKPYTNEEFENGVADLRHFLAARRGNVLDQIGALRAQPQVLGPKH